MQILCTTVLDSLIGSMVEVLNFQQSFNVLSVMKLAFFWQLTIFKDFTR